MKPAIDKKFLFWFSVEILNEILVFLKEDVSLLSEPEKEILDESPHELEFLQNKGWLVNVIQSSRNDIENPLDSIPYVIGLRVRIRKQKIH